MINATQLRKGMIIRLNEKLYRIEEMDHVTPGKGQALVQTKIRDLTDLTTRNHRFRSSEKVERVVLQTRNVAFLYQDGTSYVFMDNENYEQIALLREFLEEKIYYLKENENYTLELYENQPMNLIPPLTMEFSVKETEKTIKGATVQSSYKPAILENGMEIMVPSFIEPCNLIKIDTRDGSYIERSSK